MMIVASVVPNFLMGIMTGAGILGIMLLLGGFFKLPHDIPIPVWRYPLHFVAFHTFANRGMFKNEYEGLRFASNEVGGGYISGEEVLRYAWQVDMSYSKWVDLAILIGMIFLYRVLFLVIIKVKEKVRPVVVSLSCMSASSKRTIQVMENPNATPLHWYLRSYIILPLLDKFLVYLFIISFEKTWSMMLYCVISIKVYASTVQNTLFHFFLSSLSLLCYFSSSKIKLTIDIPFKNGEIRCGAFRKVHTKIVLGAFQKKNSVKSHTKKILIEWTSIIPLFFLSES